MGLHDHTRHCNAKPCVWARWCPLRACGPAGCPRAAPRPPRQGRGTEPAVFVSLLRKKELSLFTLNFHFCVIPEMEHLFTLVGIFCEYPILSSSRFSLYLPSFNFNDGVHKHTFSIFTWSHLTICSTMATATRRPRLWKYFPVLSSSCIILVFLCLGLSPT